MNGIADEWIMSRDRKLFVLLCGLVVATILGMLISKLPAIRRFIAEEGPDLEGEAVLAWLAREAGGTDQLPSGFKGLRGRVDPTDGSPMWGVFQCSSEDFQAFKLRVANHYQHERGGAPFTLDDADVDAKGRPKELPIMIKTPDWWGEFKYPNPDVYYVAGKGVWIYFVYSPQERRGYYHHSTW